MILASTAIPTPKIKAAIPGSVRTPDIILKNTTVRYTYATIITLATNPGNLYTNNINAQIIPSAIAPANTVWYSASAPNWAPTELE